MTELEILQDRLSDALTRLSELERAATEVNRLGARTGPQWSRLGAALLHARVHLINAGFKK